MTGYKYSQEMIDQSMATLLVHFFQNAERIMTAGDIDTRYRGYFSIRPAASIPNAVHVDLVIGNVNIWGVVKKSDEIVGACAVLESCEMYGDQTFEALKFNDELIKNLRQIREL